VPVVNQQTLRGVWPPSAAGVIRNIVGGRASHASSTGIGMRHAAWIWPAHMNRMTWNAMALRGVKQSRHQLPPSQVTGSAEDNEYVWFELIVGFHRAQLAVQSV